MKLRCLALLLTLGVPCTHARAADLPHRAEPPDEDESYETMVTASRYQESAFHSTRSVDVVERKRMNERSVSTTPEAVQETTGIYVQRTNGAGGSPIVRGLLGQHVLLLIDGVRLNTAITRFGPNQLLNTVDPFSLQRIEVLRGPGSVVYGSDALGGVINLIPRTPTFDPRRAWDVETEALGRFQSASMGVTGHAEVEGHIKSVGARVAGTLQRFGDLRGGSDTGVQPFTSYWEGNADAAVSWHIDDSSTLKLSYAAVRQNDAIRTDRATAIDFQRFTDQYRDLVALDYRLAPDWNWLKQLRATVSYQLHRELRERFRIDRDRIDRERDDVGQLGTLISARSDLPYNRLSYGVDVYFDRVGSSAERERISAPEVTPQARGRYLDGSTYWQVGAWLMDHVHLLDDKLAVEVGGRVNTWIAAVPADTENDLPAVDTASAAVVGSARLRYLVGDGLNLIAGLSQGLRAPNIDDYSAQGCSGQGYDVPNPSLDAERSATAETGVKLDLWGRLRASLFYAYTYLDDAIVRRELSDEPPRVCGTNPDGSPIWAAQTRRENAQQGHVHSIEAQVSLALSRSWNVFGWIAWNHGQVTLDEPGDPSEPMSRVPPLNGLAGLRYRAPRARGFGELALRWATAQDRLSSGDLNDGRICPVSAEDCDGTPGYAVLRLRGGVRLHDQVQLLLALENLTHQSYRVHGSGIDGPGINAMVTLQWTTR